MTNWISPWQYKSTALLRWRPVCSKPKAVKVLASAWPVASSTPNSMKLKPPERAAVECTGGPVLVLAGAGSG